jgi:hypothetical protein
LNNSFSNKHVSFLRYFLSKEVREFACFEALLQPIARLVQIQPLILPHLQYILELYSLLIATFGHVILNLVPNRNIISIIQPNNLSEAFLKDKLEKYKCNP